MTSQTRSKPGFSVKISALWSVFLFGIIFHTQLGLIPLFHGLDVLAAHGHMANDISQITPILWLMLGFFMLPLLAIIALCFFDSRRFRVGHFWFTVFYSVMNFAHLVVDLTIQPIAWYQIALMTFLFLNGLILNIVAYQWVREIPWHRQHRLESVH